MGKHKNKKKMTEDIFEKDILEDCNTCDLLGAQLYQTTLTPLTTQEKSPYTPFPEAPDIKEIGNAGWTLLHTIAAYYPDNPTQEKVENTRSFLKSFGQTFPCDYCGNGFLDIIKRKPPTLDNRENFSLWMCEAHNEVNAHLGKPIFDCNDVDARWRID